MPTIEYLGPLEKEDEGIEYLAPLETKPNLSEPITFPPQWLHGELPPIDRKKMEESLIDAKTMSALSGLDIKPSMAYRYRDQIDKNIEDSWGSILLKSGKSIYPAFATGVGGMIRAGEEFISPETEVNRAVEENKEYLEGYTGPRPIKTTLGQETADYWSKILREQEINAADNKLKKYAGWIVQNVAQNLPMLAIGAATGGTTVPLTIFGLQAGGQKYQQMREAGQSPEVSAPLSTITGTSEAVTELLPLNVLIRPGIAFAKRLLLSAALDVPGELINTSVESSIDKVTITPEMTMDDFGKALAETAIVALGSAGLLTSIAHPIVWAREQATKKDQTIQSAKDQQTNEMIAEQDVIIQESTKEITDKLAEAKPVEQEDAIPEINEEQFDKAFDKMMASEEDITPEEMLKTIETIKPEIDKVLKGEPVKEPWEMTRKEFKKARGKKDYPSVDRDVPMYQQGKEIPQVISDSEIEGYFWSEKDFEDIAEIGQTLDDVGDKNLFGKQGSTPAPYGEGYIYSHRDRLEASLLYDYMGRGNLYVIKGRGFDRVNKGLVSGGSLDQIERIFPVGEIISIEAMTQEELDDIPDYHSRIIQQALSEGKSIPQEVLKDYPELNKEREKGQSLYSFPANLAELDINQAMTHLVEVGKSIYQAGMKFKEFAGQMKTQLGEAWDRFKDVMQKVYDETVRILKEERGEIGKPDKEAKKRIREITGQTKGEPTVTEPSALKAAMKKAETASKTGFKEGVKVGIEKATTPKELTLKQRIRAITGQTGEKATIGEDDALNAAFTKAQRAAREAFRAGNKEGVAKERQHMQDILTWKAYKEARKIEIKKDIKTLKKIKEKTEGKIALDYQKKIKELLEGIDFTNPTEATIEKLKGLQDFIEREGVPLGISNKELSQLKRLSDVSFKDMSISAQKELLATAQKLYDLGKLKRELQLNKEAREKQENLDSLIESTVNLDPVLSGEKKPTKTDTYKVGYKRLSMDVLHAFRQADIADGVREYKGENVRMIKEEMQAEITAKNEAQRRIHEGIIEKIKDSGINDITEEMSKRINVVLMVEMGAKSQASALMEAYGMEATPELTESEQTIVNILRKIVGEKTKEITKIYEQLENKEFIKVDNYFPIKYESDFNMAPSDAINQNRYRTRKTEQGFTIKRKPGVKDLPRLDILAVAEEAIIDQEWYIHMQPLLAKHAELTRTPEYREAAGDMMWSWWKDQVDIVARKGWTATARGNPALRTFRINLNQAILGYKATSMLMQPFAIFDAMAYVMPNYGPTATAEILSEFTKTWINPKRAMEFVNQSPVLKLRKAGEVAVEESLEKTKGMKGVKKKFYEWAFAGIRTADIITAAGVEKGLLRILKKHNIPNTEMEAEFLMNVVSGSSEVSIRPHILARGEGARTWLTFQTFFLNRWGIISHDLIRSGLKGDAKKKAMSLLGLMILMAGGMLEDEARDLITGKKTIDEAMFKKVLLYLPRQLPVIGGLFEKWASAEPPVIRTAGKVGVGTQQIAESKWSKGLPKIMEGIMTLLLGIPGTAQLFDLLEGDKKEKKEKR